MELLSSSRCSLRSWLEGEGLGLGSLLRFLGILRIWCICSFLDGFEGFWIAFALVGSICTCNRIGNRFCFSSLSGFWVVLFFLKLDFFGLFSQL